MQGAVFSCSESFSHKHDLNESLTAFSLAGTVEGVQNAIWLRLDLLPALLPLIYADKEPDANRNLRSELALALLLLLCSSAVNSGSETSSETFARTQTGKPFSAMHVALRTNKFRRQARVQHFSSKLCCFLL